MLAFRIWEEGNKEENKKASDHWVQKQTNKQKSRKDTVLEMEKIALRGTISDPGSQLP